MAEREDRQFLIEKLRPAHDRAGFSCGHSSLDDFLRKYAGQNQRRGVSQTFVAIRRGEPIVRGYYTLSAGRIESDHIPMEHRAGLPRYPAPVAHLGRLAVDSSVRGQGLGELLLLDSFARTVSIADSLGIHAIEVVAIDDRAREFYLKYAFIPLVDDPRHLYLPLHLIRSLGLDRPS